MKQLFLRVLVWFMPSKLMRTLKRFTLLVLACFSITQVDAQFRVDKKTYKNVFKFDILNAALNNEYIIAYERTVGDDFSIVLTGGALAKNYELNETFANGTTRDQFNRTSGWLIQSEARFYLSEFTGARQPGAYLGVYPFFRTEFEQFQGGPESYPGSPGFSYELGDLLWADYESQFDQFGLGFTIGLQVFTAHQLGIEMQFFANIQYSDLDIEGTEVYTNGFRSIDRSQFNRDFTSGLRLQVMFGTRPKA